MEIAGYRVSKHLEEYLKEERAYIKQEWIERTINNPDFIMEVSSEEIRLWKQIPEFGDRFLRVVVNPKGKVIITAFFDRRFKR